LPLARQAGVTRLADITGLDVVGVPVFQSIRPGSCNISLSNGKGLTRDQAKVSALMEALECYHAEVIRQPSRREAVGAMRRMLKYDPYSLAAVRDGGAAVRRDFDYDPFLPPCGAPCLLTDQAILDWVKATDLSTGSATWVPRQLVELNFAVEERLCPPWFRATSNGLASGNAPAEAIIHGLCELIERDGIGRAANAASDPERHIIPATIESRVSHRLMRRFAEARLRMAIIDVSGPMGLPCFEVILADADQVAYKGYGCHPCRETALLRALTEAAQSRVSHIAGTRDDMYRETYRDSLRWPAAVAHASLEIMPQRDYRECPDLPMGPWTEVLDDLVRRVRMQTGTSPVAVDLTREEFGLPVVFVVAPGLGFLLPFKR
jgi:ribosomal protein S12 methylthiotransferase accessory factor